MDYSEKACQDPLVITFTQHELGIFSWIYEAVIYESLSAQCAHHMRPLPICHIYQQPFPQASLM